MKKLLLAFLTLALVGGVACSVTSAKADKTVKTDKKKEVKSDKEEDKDKKKEIVVPVKLYTLNTGEISSFVLSSATVEAEMSVDIVAETSGIVEKLFVEEGNRVKKGESLANVNFEELKNARDKAEMSFQEAKNKFDRTKEIFSKNLVSQEEYDNANFSFQQSKLDFQNAEIKLQKSIIKAPFDGKIMEREITGGQFVTVNQKAFSLVNQDILKVNVFVSEEVVGKIKDGMPAELDSEALGKVFKAQVKRISGVVDPKTGTIKVTIFVEKDKDLRPGMYVKVKILTDTKPDALLIPKKAIVYVEDKKFIFIYNKDKKTVKRMSLAAGYQNDDYIETLNPELKKGDEVVIAGQSTLKDESKVKVN